MKYILFCLNSIQTDGGSHCKFSSQKVIQFSLHFGLNLGSSNWFHTCQLTQSRAVTSTLKLDSMLSYNMGVSLQLLHGKPFWAGKTRIKSSEHWQWMWEEAINHALRGVRIWNTYKRTDVSEQIISCSIALRVNVRVEWKLLDYLIQPRSWESVKESWTTCFTHFSQFGATNKGNTSEYEGRLWPLLRKWVVSGIKYSPEAGPHLINNPRDTVTEWEGR